MEMELHKQVEDHWAGKVKDQKTALLETDKFSSKSYKTNDEASITDQSRYYVYLDLLKMIQTEEVEATSSDKVNLLNEKSIIIQDLLYDITTSTLVDVSEEELLIQILEKLVNTSTTKIQHVEEVALRIKEFALTREFVVKLKLRDKVLSKIQERYQTRRTLHPKRWDVLDLDKQENAYRLSKLHPLSIFKSIPEEIKKAFYFDKWLEDDYLKEVKDLVGYTSDIYGTGTPLGLFILGESQLGDSLKEE